MDQFVIYKNPKESPNKVVVRHWVECSDGFYPNPESITVNSIEEARAVIPKHYKRRSSAVHEGTGIAEVWS